MDINQINAIRQSSAVEKVVGSLTGEQDVQGPKGPEFSSILTEALNGVNDAVLQSDQLSVQAMIDPESVDVHEVTIAMSKANMAVSLTKQVVDGALRAYKEIINLR